MPTSAEAGVETSAHDVGMQISGDCYRMEYQSFRGHLDRNRDFSRLIALSIEAFSVQVAHTAVSNAFHDVDERLARWLLMCDDRVSGHELALTRDFISLMLAVRRPSVTTSLHILECLLKQQGLANRTGISVADVEQRPSTEFGPEQYAAFQSDTCQGLSSPARQTAFVARLMPKQSARVGRPALVCVSG